MTDLTTLGIAEAGRLMARGEMTSSALTEAFLKRIGAVDGKIASYITVTADMARNAARQADREMKGGVRRGPMHGIPIALKDIYETAGVRTTGHSHLKVDYVPAIDAETVRQRFGEPAERITGPQGESQWLYPDRGIAVVLVEQSVNVALTVAQRAYFLERGEIRFAGPTAELLERPDILRSVFLSGASAAVAPNAASSGRGSRISGRFMRPPRRARRCWGRSSAAAAPAWRATWTGGCACTSRRPTRGRRTPAPS